MAASASTRMRYFDTGTCGTAAGSSANCGSTKTTRCFSSCRRRVHSARHSRSPTMGTFPARRPLTTPTADPAKGPSSLVMKGSPVRVRASALVGALKLATAILSPVPQERLGRLEPLRAVTAEIGGCLRKVDQVRTHVHRELGGAEIQQKFSGHRVFVRRPVLGERLQRRLDAPQAPDVGERACNGTTLGASERARRRASCRLRSRSRSRCRMPASAVATRRYQRENGDGERECPCRPRRITGRG